MRILAKLAVIALSCVAVQKSEALSPPSHYILFYDKISYSPDIQPGVWSGRSDLCLKKARETGWLMLWFLASRGDRYSCWEFLENNLCRQKFCDVINNYKYIILCCDDYSSPACCKLKNKIYGYPEPKRILDKSTGKYVDNHRGYPFYVQKGIDSSGKPVYSWCDIPPSVHLIKVDANTNIIFHIGTKAGSYDVDFSPYAEKFPIPEKMCMTRDSFAPWLKGYLDMYPVEEEIEEYENSEVKEVTYTGPEYEYVTNTVVVRKEVAVTDTINPTVYQMALHRDNILFRTVTVLGDVLVLDRIGDNWRDFDGRTDVRNADGKWYVNHDNTLSSVMSTVSDETAIDVYAKTNCTIFLRQRFGNGFSLKSYDLVTETVVTNQDIVFETGEMVHGLSTNMVTKISGTPLSSADIGRAELYSTGIVSGKLYRVSSKGNTTFDVFSTK